MISCIVCSITNYGIRACGPIIFVALCGVVIYLLVRWVCKNNDIRLSDENLERNLDDYLKIKKPDFAVMITGCWGTGKTYFIRQYIQKQRKLNPFGAPIYVSLYGIENEKMLEREFLKSIFTTLFSVLLFLFSTFILFFCLKSIAWKNNILWSILLTTLGFIYGSFKLKFFQIITKRRLIIFDDLERAKYPADKLLAYINRYVEHMNKHVIVICNEKEIKIKNYSQIKEKVFGKTFEISPTSEDIIRGFISPKHTPLLHELINKKSFDWFYERSVVRKIPVNLRAFRHVVMEFERTFQRVDRNKLFDKAIIKHIIPDFFCVLYASECPEFSPEEKFNFNKLNIMVKPLEDNEENEWLNKYFPYAFQKFNQSLLPMDYWEALVQHKNVVIQKINEHWELLIHGDPRLFTRSFKIFEMSDKEINEFFQDLKKQMKSKELCNPYEILCIVGNLLDFFKSSSDKIQKHAKTYIALLEKGNFFPDEFLNLAVFLEFKFSHEKLYESYPIPYAHTATGEELKNYLTDKLCAFYVQNKKKIFEKYLQQLMNYDDEENLQWWIKHSEVDLFSNLGDDDPKRLFDVLFTLNEKDFRSQLSRLTNHLGEIVGHGFDNTSFWTRFNEIAKPQIAEWDAGNMMFSKNRSLKSFCASVDRYIADVVINVAENERNKTLNNPEKDSDQ